MADLKFSCPHCQQHIQAEAGYAGLQINCPACHGSLIVPATLAVPPPPPPPVYSTQSAPPAPPPPPVPASAAMSPAGTSGCPSCNAPLGRGAVLCTKCGFNLATGKRTVAGKVVAPGKPQADPWATPWYKTAYPYVAVVVVILATLFFLGRNNPDVKAVFYGVAALYVLTAQILVVVAAFREGMGIGFLTLCVPLYNIYFVFKVNDSDTLKIVVGIAILVNIGLMFAQ